MRGLQMERNKWGFTLVEMLIVVAIISIIVVMAVPRADEWYKIRRVQDAATRLASTLERLKVTASRNRRPYAVAFIDSNHYAVFFIDGTLGPRFMQPDASTSYYGSSITNPFGGGANVPNPMPSRVDMGTWTGVFSGSTTNAIIVTPNGGFQRFSGTAFASTTIPLGDVFSISFTDSIIQAGSNFNLKEISSWRVDVEPAGNVAVKRLHSKED
jgi:prepilin-type N-terminal cleavage/methylation domain-containing protein